MPKKVFDHNKIKNSDSQNIESRNANILNDILIFEIVHSKQGLSIQCVERTCSK